MLTRAEIKTNAKRALEGKWGKGALITLAYVVFFYVVGFLIGLLSFIPIINQLLSIANSIIQIPLALGLTFAFIKLRRGEAVKAFDFLELGFSNFKKAWAIVGRTLLKMIVPIIIMIVLLIGIMFFGVLSVGTLVGSSVIKGSDYSYDDFDFNEFKDSVYDYNYDFEDISYNPYARSSSSGISQRNMNSDISAGLVGVGVGSVIIAAVIALAYFGVSIWATCKGLYYALAQFIAFDNPNMTGKEIVQKSEDLMRGNRAKLFTLNLSFIGWMILAGITLGIGMLWLMPYMIISQICFYESLLNNNNNNNNGDGMTNNNDMNLNNAQFSNMNNVQQVMPNDNQNNNGIPVAPDINQNNNEIPTTPDVYQYNNEENNQPNDNQNNNQF